MSLAASPFRPQAGAGARRAISSGRAVAAVPADFWTRDLALQACILRCAARAALLQVRWASPRCPEAQPPVHCWRRALLESQPQPSPGIPQRQRALQPQARALLRLASRARRGRSASAARASPGRARWPSLGTCHWRMSHALRACGGRPGHGRSGAARLLQLLRRPHPLQPLQRVWKRTATGRKFGLTFRSTPPAADTGARCRQSARRQAACPAPAGRATCRQRGYRCSRAGGPPRAK
mmetsp:Transcript_52226/g.148898  ORF Transcript_52226/g.148898 Transcript_52226/m.148898 type:complete len:238 (-) Transcript_52226:177-890(-)